MKSRILNFVAFAACPILFHIGQMCHAEDQPQKPVKTIYSLCGGSCKRSMEVVAMFDDPYVACEAADKLRKTEKYVGLIAGEHVDPLLVHPAIRDHQKPKSNAIVRQSIRCGIWVLERSPASAKDPEATVSEIRKAGRLAEVIYQMPDKD